MGPEGCHTLWTRCVWLIIMPGVDRSLVCIAALSSYRACTRHGLLLPPAHMQCLSTGQEGASHYRMKVTHQDIAQAKVGGWGGERMNPGATSALLHWQQLFLHA